MIVDWNARRAEVARIARRVGFTHAGILAEWSRPAAQLISLLGMPVEMGASKLGGLLDLAASEAWPSGRHGSMTLLGQVDTAETVALAGVDGWPATTVLLPRIPARCLTGGSRASHRPSSCDTRWR